MAGRTLDYLGLVDTPQTARATLARPVGLETLMEGQRSSASGLQPFLTELPHLQRSINRIRSYSVNAKEKYAEDEEEEETLNMYGSGAVTPMAAAAGAMNAQIQATAQALAMAQYAALATPSRSRARTVGVLEQPPVNRMKNYLATPSKLDSMTTASEIQLQKEYFELTEAIRLAQRNLAETALGQTPDGNLEGPTRSLWLGNIPASTTTTSLVHIFQPYGEVESARVLTHKNCGFINYTTVEHAIQARMSLNGKEIFPGAGPIRIGFAKPSSPNSNGAPTPNGGVYPSHSPEPIMNNSGSEGAGASLSRDRSNIGANGKPSAVNNIEIPTLREMKEEILKIVPKLEANEADVKSIEASIDTAIVYDDFATEIPTIPEPSHNRVHDAPKLREIRKRIDNGNIDSAEMEQIAIEMLPEISELSSGMQYVISSFYIANCLPDYLGNTVVQKLFEYCNEDTKQKMLERIAPHLAEIGIHKNGTWAGQKIIDVAKTPQQMQTIRDCLRQYTVALFLDQYGNYVLQCCLRFGSPYNDYIFETMLSRMWEISQGRYGSRAVRACLESHHSSKNQQRMMAAAIALNAVSLATNANGALLLTWLLDTSTLPNRRTILAPRLIPHLVHLCTHKLAYLTVLKVINQKTEPEARETTLKALFFSEGNVVLEEILKDHACGPTFIFKVLTTPFFEDPMRAEVIQNVRNVLTKMGATPQQGYKRLMDEVGLSTRTNNHHDGRRDRGDSANGNGTPHNRRSQNNSSVNTPIQAPRNLDAPTQPQFFSPPGMFDPSLGSPAHFSPNGAVDPQAIRALQEQSAMYSAQVNAMYGGGAPPVGNPAMGNPALQIQLLQQQMSGSGRSAGFYGSPNMPGFNGQQPPANGGDQFRGGQGGSPMPPPGMGNMMGNVGNNAAYNPVVAQQLMGSYPPYGNNQIFGNQQGQQSQNGTPGGRRQGRVSTHIWLFYENRC